MFRSQLNRNFVPLQKQIMSLVLCTTTSFGLAILPTTAQVGGSDGTGSESTGCGDQVWGPPSSSTPPAADDVAPDYFIQAETNLSSRTFEHESFTLRSIVKSSICYYPAASASLKKAYEQLWYCDGKPLGMERTNGLDIPADKNVGIKIVQPNCASFDETKAASNVIMRLVLDVLKNRDKVSKVSVPSSSYNHVLMELQRRGGTVLPPGEKAPTNARVKFIIESESTTMKQHVYWI